MTTKHPRMSLIIYPDMGESVERLMAQTRRRKSSILKEALAKGLRQMEREQVELEKLAQTDY